MNTPSFGALESINDPRTIKHEELSMASPVALIKGGHDYKPENIEHQHSIGICTAISLVQNREFANKKKYSPDFQYLLQKRYIDQNWAEGSSIFSALKVGKTYGFLPKELFDKYITETDRQLSYTQYILKLQAIPLNEILELLKKCVDKIEGYAQVDINAYALAKAIRESDAGILCRYNVGMEWWTPSWLERDISPLKAPKTIVSGHAINMTSFDYTNAPKQILANTWGIQWSRQGCADVIFDQYKPTEAWVILPFTPDKFKFNKNLSIGMTDPDIERLQTMLGVKQTGFFGPLTLAAVIAFQKKNNISPAVGYVGPLTRQALNKVLG